jgi:K+-sensing histidine kinase KdpD
MKLFVVSLLVLLALSVATVTPAFAMESCDHEMSHDPTVAGLAMHVEHAYEMGHIDNPGIRTVLLALLDNASRAAEKGSIEQQVHALETFIQFVEAQSGKHIAAECSAHLVMHAEHVIMALHGHM